MPLQERFFIVKPDHIAVHRSNRTINQYIKKHSTNFWAFHDKKYYTKGLYPTKPLCLRSSNVFHEAGLLPLKIYAERKLHTGKLNTILKQAQSKRFDTKNANLKMIINLMKYTKQRSASTKCISLNNQELLTKSKELFNIYNNVLYNAIKSINITKMRKA